MFTSSVLSVAILVAVALASYVLWQGFCFLQNYVAARRFGVPIVLSPFATESHAGHLVLQMFRPLLLRLPIGYEHLTTYDRPDWNFHDKFAAHEKLGKVFARVTCSGIGLYIADAKMVDTILFKRKEFPKPVEKMEPMNLFGKNLATVEGADWQRHRKITSTFFNERHNVFVWQESSRQAEQMLAHWTSSDAQGVDSVSADSMTLGLHVLMSNAMGMQHDFQDASKVMTEDVSSYRNSLAKVLDGIILIFAVGTSPLGKFASLSQNTKRCLDAASNWKNHMIDMVDEEMRRFKTGEARAETLLKAMVDLSLDSEAATKISKNPEKSGLSDSEIYGNIFMFTLAGHESTANALTYTIYLLAAFPKWQLWVMEEIDRVLEEWKGRELDYAQVFPKLTRCMAMMLETVRLYGPVTAISKTTGQQAQSLKSNGRELEIPAGTSITVNSIALHTLPEYWGPDSLLWQPSRWITEDNELLRPTKGTYVAFADGPRVCPGKNFAKVEFVAVLIKILSTHKIETALRPGETEQAARTRTYRTVCDSQQKLSVQIKDPKSVSLRFVARV